ncbi:MAG: nicotinate-nucleotide--dimethylbenzimidazole phosphoribosyltransferase [Planctomycetota bacterium]
MTRGIDWTRTPSAALDRQAGEAATARQASLTKPPGSLGRLEELAVWLAERQACDRPTVDAPAIAVFAADHGIATHGVSAFPSDVTGQMVANFSAGGAAICVLAAEFGATFEVVDVGTHVESHDEGVIVDRVARGSADMLARPALGPGELEYALGAGRRAVERARARGADVLVVGEMGIGNTTAASAVSAAILGTDGGALAGPGTGLDARGVARKAELVDRAIDLHGLGPTSDPLHVLECVGGHELAALTGAYLSAAELGLPAVVDGFIGTASALVAVRTRPDSAEWLLCAHASAEPGHRLVLEALGRSPLLDLGLRLGEGSGAALAIPLLRAACSLHRSMATFEEAGVANRA